MASILVCDQSTYLRSVIKSIFENSGHEIVGEARDGQEALNKYKSLDPDVITLDLILPKKHGLDTFKEIKSLNSDAKILVVSAVKQEPVINKMLELGAFDFITKPFSSEDLLGSIGSMTSV